MKVEELLELFDSRLGYKRRQSLSWKEEYVVDTGIPGAPIIVEIKEYPLEPKTPENNMQGVFVAQVDFTDAHGSYDLTNIFARNNINPVKVFGTVIDIVKKSPMVKRMGGIVYFSSELNNTSRARLYERILKSTGVSYNKEVRRDMVHFVVWL